MLERITVNATTTAIQGQEPDTTTGKDERHDRLHSAFLHSIELAHEEQRQERRNISGFCDRAVRSQRGPRDACRQNAQHLTHHSRPPELQQSENTGTLSLASSTESAFKCSSFAIENSLPLSDPSLENTQLAAQAGMAANRHAGARPDSGETPDGSLTPCEYTARSAVEGADIEELEHSKLDNLDSGFPEPDCAAGMESAFLAMPGSPRPAPSGASGAEVRRSLQVDPAFLAMIEYASTSRLSNGEFEFQFALGAGAGTLAKLQIAVTSLGRNRIGLNVRGRKHEGISKWFTGQLVEALREQGIDVVD